MHPSLPPSSSTNSLQSYLTFIGIGSHLLPPDHISRAANAVSLPLQPPQPPLLTPAAQFLHALTCENVAQVSRRCFAVLFVLVLYMLLLLFLFMLLLLLLLRWCVFEEGLVLMF